MRPISDFTQTEPVEGVPATQATEVWVLFDERAVSVSFRCDESHPDRMVLNEMRRDSFNLIQNDGVSFMLDTYQMTR